MLACVWHRGALSMRRLPVALQHRVGDTPRSRLHSVALPLEPQGFSHLPPPADASPPYPWRRALVAFPPTPDTFKDCGNSTTRYIGLGKPRP